MAKEWDLGRCNDKSGFLFSHTCFRPQEYICETCQKPVCEDHIVQLDANFFCTTCVKKKQTKKSGHQSGHRRNDVYDDYHDPYFYGGYYYGHGYYGHGYYGHHHGYHSHSSSHHDPNDFTEADAESLVDEADDDFENDMSES